MLRGGCNRPVGWISGPPERNQPGAGYSQGMTPDNGLDRTIAHRNEDAAASSEDAPEGTATGVATGGLGTAANLEDTQVLSSAELAAAAAAVEPDRAEPPPPGATAGTPAAAWPVAAAAGTTATAGQAAAASPGQGPSGQAAPALSSPINASAVGAAPVHAAPVRAVRAGRERADPHRGRGLAAVLAAALVVLGGVAFVIGQGGDPIDPARAAPTTLSTVAPDGDAAGEKDREPDEDKNKGNGKDCRGNGRGHGCDGDGGGGGGGNRGEGDDD